MNALTRALRTTLAVTFVAATLAACGDSEPAQTGSTGQPADATTIAVSATEYTYEVSATTAPAGAITFELTNDGMMEHDLVLEGDPGGNTEIIGSGETDSFTVTLEPGTYTLYCSVGNHRAQGMEFTFTVS
ncbi:cupredoxin domain-containing protein [Demequina sp.]|uniref:cupredoxin domain-containing protein n=1 Tax=Demequina sp. TaxID=2050685 RepID=UPI003D127976